MSSYDDDDDDDMDLPPPPAPAAPSAPSASASASSASKPPLLASASSLGSLPSASEDDDDYDDDAAPPDDAPPPPSSAPIAIPSATTRTGPPAVPTSGATSPPPTPKAAAAAGTSATPAATVAKLPPPVPTTSSSLPVTSSAPLAKGGSPLPPPVPGSTNSAAAAAVSPLMTSAGTGVGPPALPPPGRSGAGPSPAIAAIIAASAAVRAESESRRTASMDMSARPSSATIASAGLSARRGSLWLSLLQKSYNPPFLSPSASILHHSGPLKKFGSKLTPSSLNARHFVLANHSLQYHKSDPFKGPQGSFSLVGATLSVEADSETMGLKPPPHPNCCFSLTPRGASRTYLLVCEDPNQRNVWLELLGYSTVDSKRLTLSPQPASRWNEDSNLLVEGWVTKRGGDAKAPSWKKRYCMYQRALHTFSYFKSAPPRAAGFVPIEKGAIVDTVNGARNASVALTELQKYSDRTLALLPPVVDSQSVLAYTQSEDRCYVMLAPSRAERDEWVSAIRGAVAYCDGDKPSWEPQKSKHTRNSSAHSSISMGVAGAGAGGVRPPPVPLTLQSANSTPGTSNGTTQTAASGGPPPVPSSSAPSGGGSGGSTDSSPGSARPNGTGAGSDSCTSTPLGSPALGATKSSPGASASPPPVPSSSTSTSSTTSAASTTPAASAATTTPAAASSTSSTTTPASPAASPISPATNPANPNKGSLAQGKSGPPPPPILTIGGGGGSSSDPKSPISPRPSAAQQQKSPTNATSSKGPPPVPASLASALVPSSPPPPIDDDDEWDQSSTLTGVRTKGQSVSYVSLSARSGPPVRPSMLGGSGAPPKLPPALGSLPTARNNTAQPSKGKFIAAATAANAAANAAAAANANANANASANTPAPAPSSSPANLGALAEDDEASVVSDENRSKASSLSTPSPSSNSSSAGSSATTTPASNSFSNGNLAMVEKSISELYSTETTYVAVLNTICSAYLLRFRKHLDLGLEPKWFDDTEYASFNIFQQVASIRDINARLLKELQAINLPKDGSGAAVIPSAVATATVAATTTSTATTPTTPANNTPSGAAAAATAAVTAAAAAAAASSTQSAAELAAAAAAAPTMPEGSRMHLLARIGSTFRQFIPWFKVYSSYAKSYDDVRLFELLSERRSSLKNFLLLTDACEGTTLATLMITPVQRVGRYVMLLETILKNAPRGGPGGTALDGLADIELALAEMKRVASLINETVALWEATSKVVELQAKMDSPILQPGRYLVREGVLKKLYKRDPTQGFFSSLARKEAPFIFFLLNDALLQAKKTTLSVKYTLRATMPLHGMTIEDVPDSDLVKNAWTINYGDGFSGGGASSNLAMNPPMSPSARQSEANNSSGSGAGGGSNNNNANSEAQLQISPLHQRRSSDQSEGPLSPTGGGGGGGDRKVVMVYARDAEQKAQWMADILSLIEQTKQKKTTLGRQGSTQHL